MDSVQYFPIQPALLSLACETVNRRIGRLPFMKNGISVTPELVGVSLECLNAEVTRTLPLRTSPATAKNRMEGFDLVLELRLGTGGRDAASVIADVLVQSGIAEVVQMHDRSTHTRIKGLRLLRPWSWHIASGTPAPLQSLINSPESEPSATWLAQCPVCRSGILMKVTGKQLFGMPFMEYYIECTHCCAKFVREKENFRLVSIAKIRDPRWRKLLNMSRKAEDWATLARGDPLLKRLPDPARNPVPLPVDKANTEPFTKTKDGSVAVPFGEKTLFFRQTSLRFGQSVKRTLFSRRNGTLADLLRFPEYNDLKQVIEQRYHGYLMVKAGNFITELKQRNDPLVQEFLHQYGDKEYCSFRMRDDDYTGQKGVILVLAKGEVKHIGTCHTSFGKLINDNLGRIIPGMCYRDGNETACKINSFACEDRDSFGIFIHVLSDDREIDAVAHELTAHYLSKPLQA